MKQLLILSGKGGTGKTTTAAAFIAFAEAQAFADCDVDAPNLHLVAQFAGEPERRPYLGGQKAEMDAETCAGCGKCAANCPVGNIGMSEGKPKFGGKCVMCARCSFYCPADAISIGLLNGWKVNGAYDFDGKQKDVSGKMPEFLKIAYEKYFQKAEEKIALLNASQPAKFSFDVQEEDSSADMTVKNNH